MLEINFTPFPNLKTERLVLRQLKTDDENEVFAIRSNERVNKYIDRPKTNSIEDARNFIHKINSRINNNESVLWAITLKNNPKLIGSITLWKINKEIYRAEIGYELHPAFHRKGIMHEALIRVVKFGFQTLKLKTIVAFTNKNNEPSKKLLEKNNFQIDDSMEEEKTEKEKEITLIYSLRKNDHRP